MNKLSSILKQAEKERSSLNHPYVGTEHLLLAILSKENELTDKLKTYNLTYNKFKRKLISIVGKSESTGDYILYTPMLRNVLNDAEKKAMENNDEVNEQGLFLAILNEGEGIAIRVMQAMKIDVDNICLDNSSNLMQFDENDIIFGREKEIECLCQILMRKNKCNPLLIGEAGVGKTAIVEELARRIKKNKVPSVLKNYKVIKLDLSELLSGTKYRGEFEEKLNKILKQAINSHTILFIDEIHTMVTAGGADGAIAAGDILKPYLARGDIKCIGATTTNEYHEHFMVDQALNRRFQTVIVNEPDEKETINILDKIKDNYEKFHKVKIDNSIIKEIVNIGNKFLTNRKNPDKSIELLDSCCTHANYNESKIVTVRDLYDLIYDRYGVDLLNNDMLKLLNSKKIIISQNPTELIKSLSSNYSNIINIDCRLYQDEVDIFELLGNPKDVNKSGGYLLKSALDYPLGFITITNMNYNKILKEFIDKLLNNRYIIDNYGNKLNFSNYIIILEKSLSNKSLGFTPLNSCISVNNYSFDNDNLIKL